MAPSIVAGVRQDLVVTDAATGAPRRSTTYQGTVWLGPPPQSSSLGSAARMISTPHVDHLDPDAPLRLFVPDSLPYHEGEQVTISASGAPLGGIDQSGSDSWLLYPLVAELVADPRGGEARWLGIELRGLGRLIAVGYTVSVTAPASSIASTPPATG